MYLCTYKTLEDAVRTGDVALAEKRLQFNLLGVDANNGCVMSMSGEGFVGAPLLVLAIQRNSTEMVELLLQHGAVIDNPDGRWAEVSLPYALRSADFSMVKLLADKGMAPKRLWSTANRVLAELSRPKDTEAIAFLEDLIRRADVVPDSSGTDATPEPQRPRLSADESETDG